MYNNWQKLGNIRHFKTPFKRVHSKLLACSKKKKLNCTITYDDFLKFTEIKNCHYCLKIINWIPHGKKANSYFLDRKDNNIGYSVENCVVCCSKCNEGKSDLYTYEEWFGMTEYFRNK